jgi:hypothetical protein
MIEKRWIVVTPIVEICTVSNRRKLILGMKRVKSVERTRPSDRHARQAQVGHQRQRDRADEQRDPVLDSRSQRRLALH